mmetsp:Transcript_116341/g.248853  ORF Transcript_116341/g.248853 Transcript_116341/m.248853 type:complete len:746 (-) Transcript_116341:72-2309(-)
MQPHIAARANQHRSTQVAAPRISRVGGFLLWALTALSGASALPPLQRGRPLEWPLPSGSGSTAAPPQQGAAAVTAGESGEVEAMALTPPPLRPAWLPATAVLLPSSARIIHHAGTPSPRVAVTAPGAPVQPVLPQVEAAAPPQEQATLIEGPLREIIALPELKLQRFGHKCDDVEGTTGLAPEVSLSPPTAPVPAAAEATTAGAVKPERSPGEVLVQTGMVEALEEAGSGDAVLPSAALLPEAGRPAGEVHAVSDSVAMLEARLSDAAFGNNTFPAPPALQEPFTADVHEEVIPTVPLAFQNSTVIATDADFAELIPEPPSQDSGMVSGAATERPPLIRPAQGVSSMPTGHPAVVENISVAAALLPPPQPRSVPRAGAALQRSSAGEASSGPMLAKNAAKADAEEGSSRSTLIIVLTLCVAGAVLLGGLCLGMGFWVAAVWGRLGGGKAKGDLRGCIEALPRCCAVEVERRLPASGNYDCAISKPLSSGEVLRLEVRVMGPLTGDVLTAPLTGRACVLFSAAVSRQLHDGMHPVPVAFSSGSSDFVGALSDGEDVRIQLRGEDISLFDMSGGKCVVCQAFASAPDHWQDFVTMQRATSPGAEWLPSSSMRADSTVLEFQECALLVGATVTVVGELHRSADGALSLRPWHGDGEGKSTAAGLAAQQESWRTSWERGGCEAVDAVETACTQTSPKSIPHQAPEPEVPEMLAAKVFVSDDPLLLRGARQHGRFQKLLSRVARGHSGAI